MFLALMAVLLAGDGSPVASVSESTARAPVRVWIYDIAGLPAGDITAARAEVIAIFREAGIAPSWFHCALVDGKWWSESVACESGVGPDDIVVRLLQSSRPDARDNRVALGEARVDLQAHKGSIATVFADRIARMSERAGANPSSVLGHVIAHEIGHLLLGTGRHSATGLMRPVWTDLELRRPVGLEWHFSADEARRMRAGLLQRSDGVGENGAME